MKALYTIVAGAMGVALFAFAAPQARAADSAKTVTLGASMQLTGADTNLARYFRDGYQLTVDRINEQGGIRIGDETYRLALKVLDNQSNINLGIQQYTQLVTRDKVDFLLGPYGSNHTLNESSVAEKYRVPMVEGGGAAKQIFDRGFHYIFGAAPPAENYFGSTIEMMTKLDPSVHTIALLTADDAFDVSVRAGAKALAQQHAIDIVVDQVYPEATPNFTSLLALVKSKSPDAILVGGHEVESLNFIREAKSLDVNARYLTSLTVGVPSHDFRAALGKDAEGVFGMTPWVMSPVMHDRWFGDGQQFAQLFEQRFNYEPDYHVAAAVAAVETYAYALEAAGTLDRDKVRDAIAKSDFESVYAPVRYQANGQIDIPQIVIQVENGKVVPIYTDHFLNKPNYPVPPWTKRK
ncbi:MAG TPA: amino acid ABC transporter substrate-binding protein [Stellaceae bacterium]|nr:amino acid ABC transporter substrate-binding protein [Stellaceae bacterium]